ncbi:MAG: transposase, partial [Ghiorsea sp.]
RANQTLQDRLIKEMRLAGISDMEAGNAFIMEYMQKHNDQFAVTAASEENAHRPGIHSEEELDLIFSIHQKRKLTKDLSLQYDNTVYQIQIKGIGYAMRGAEVTVCEGFDGKVTLLYKGKAQKYTTYKRGEKPQPVADEKTINHAVDQVIEAQKTRSKFKPRIDHPWRRAVLPSTQKRTILNCGKGDISTLR